MRVAEESEDTGTLQAIKALDSLESKLNQVQVAYQQFYTTIGIEGVWKTALDGTKSFIDSLNSLPKLFNTIPVGAVTVLIDAITLIKDVAFRGLTLIANNFNETLEKMKGDGQQKGEEIGRATAEAIQQGATSTPLKNEVITREQVEEAKRKAEEIKAALQTTTEDYSLFGGTTIFQEELNGTINHLLQLGAITREDAQELSRLTPPEAIQKLQQLGQEAGQAATRLNEAYQSATGFSGIMNKVGQYMVNNRSKITNVAMALNILANFLNDGTRQGEIFSGTLMGISGAASTVVGVLSGDVTQIVRGIITLINGISTIAETNQEKLERLTKEAEELNNEAKKVKADYNTLQRTATKLDELKEKRYEGAEAAEEYQNAVDELAEKFPNLIAGFDDAGNVIINTTDIENTLAEAREKSAKATYDALEAELKKAELEKENKKKEVNALDYKFRNNATVFDAAWQYLGDSRNSDNYIEKISNFVYTPDFSELYGKIFAEEITNPLNALEKMELEFKKVGNLDSLINQYGEEYGDAIKEFWNLIEYNSFAIEDELKALQDIYYSLPEPDEENYEEELSFFKTQIANFINAHEDFKFAFDSWIGQDGYIGLIMDGLSEVKSLEGLSEGRSKAVISQWARTLDNDGKIWEVLSDESQMGSLITQAIYEDVQEKSNGNWADYKDTQEASAKVILDSFTNFYNTLDSDNKNLFKDMMENFDNYTPKDFEIWEDIPSTVLNAIESLYTKSIKNIKIRLEKNLKQVAGFDPEAEIDFNNDLNGFLKDYYNKITDEALSVNEANYLSSILSNYSELNKQGFGRRAEDIGNKALELYEKIEELGPNIEALVLSLIDENNLFTQEGINKIQEGLSNIEGTENISIALNELSSSLLYNLPLSIQTYVDKITSQIDDTEESMKKANKGLGVTEASTILEQINSIDPERQFTFNDLIRKNGKLFLTAEQKELYYQSLLDDLSTGKNDLLDRINDVGTRGKKINKQLSSLQHYNNSRLEKIEYDKHFNESVKLLTDLGYAEIYTDEAGKSFLRFTQAGIDAKNSSLGLIGTISEALNSQATNIEKMTQYIEEDVPKLNEIDSFKENQSEWSTVLNEIQSGVGEIVSDTTKEILEEAGYTFYEEMPNRIKGIGKVTEAYEKTLEKIKESDYYSDDLAKEARARIIESANKLSEARKSILEEIANSEEESFKVDISEAELDKDQEDALEKYGVKFQDGILEFTGDTNKQGLLTHLGEIFKTDAQELADAIAQVVESNYSKSADAAVSELLNSLDSVSTKTYEWVRSLIPEDAQAEFDSYFKDNGDTTYKFTGDFQDFFYLLIEYITNLSSTTFSSAEEQLRSSYEQIAGAIDYLDKDVGEIVSKEAAEMLKEAGYFLAENVDGTFTITKVGDVVQAYENFYRTIYDNDSSTENDIREARKNLIEAHNDQRKKGREFVESISELEMGDWLDFSDEFDRLGFNDIISDRETFDKYYLPEGYDGNVDLFRRFRLPDDFQEDAYNTLLGTDGIINGMTVAFATILEDGTKLTEEYVTEDYIREIRDSGAKTAEEIKAYDAEHLNLYLGIGEELAEKAHNLQAEWDQEVFHPGDEIFSPITREEMNRYAAYHNLEDDLAAAGAYIEDSILKTTENTDPLGVNKALENYYNTLVETSNDPEFKAQNEKLLAQARDNVATLVNNYIELISDGISGTLDNTSKLELENFASRYDIKLDFHETEEGLKLSQKSANELYLTMKQVDYLQSRVLFKDLSDNLKESRDAYKDVVSIQGHIASLQKEINNLPVGSARRKEYEQELEVAKEIREVRSLTDEDSFNFMDRDLPTPYKAQLGYWDSIGSAFKEMNDAAESGYMDITKFYNMVNGFNQMAANMGSSITFMGMELDGSMESASKLIQKGFSALSNVDGDGAKLSLEKFGNSFADGATGMQKGVKAGVRDMAKSQIKMLDAMIAFLEVIVAFEEFEKLDTDGKFGLSFGEMFDYVGKDANGNPIYKANQNTKKIAGHLLELAKTNKDLAKGLDDVRINGISARQALQALNSDAVKTKEEWEKYQKITDIMYRAAASGDFSTQNLTNLIREAFAGTKELVEVDIGDRHFAIKGDVLIEKDARGNYIVGGKSFKTWELAEAAYKLLEVVNAEEVFRNNDTGRVWAYIDVNNEVRIKAATDVNGEQTFTNEKTGKKTTNIKDCIDEMFEDAVKEGYAGTKVEYIIENDLSAKFKLQKSEFIDITDEPIGNLPDKILENLGIDTNLVYAVEAGIERAFQGLNLGQIILDGITQNVDLEAFQGTDIKANPQLRYIGYEFAKGVMLAFSEELQGYNKENPDLLTDEIVDGVENPKEKTMKDAAAGLRDSLTAQIMSNIFRDKMKTSGMDAAQAFVNGFTVTGGDDQTSSFAEVFGQQISNAVVTPVRNALKDLFSETSLAELIPLFETNSDLVLAFDSIKIDSLTDIANGFKTAIDTANQSLSSVVETVNKLGSEGPANAEKFKKAVNDTGSLGATYATVFKNALNAITSAGPTNTQNFKEAINNIGSLGATYATIFKNALNAIDYIGPNRAWDFVNAVNNLRSKDFYVNIYIRDNYNGGISWSAGYSSNAKGNVALAKGTLMGELGPELYVTGGRYYVAGQNGAEMVDLPDDAIVFNHLQTKKLLGTGHAGRGNPVTTEKKAVSYATGNIHGGPAMASAKETLELLKALRAMWQSMLSASFKDLGGLAKSSKDKSKTGKDDKDDTDDRIKNVRTTDDLQRWYNLERQIDKLEKDITYQESLINKYQNDRVANGKAIHKAYKEQLKMIDEELALNRELYAVQSDWYDQQRKELENSAWGKILSFNENGLQQLKGLDILEKLNEENIYGEGINRSSNVQQQLRYLAEQGFDLNDFKYNDSDLNSITKVYNYDIIYGEEGRLEGQELIDAQKQLMENFWSQLNEKRDEYDEGYDSLIELQKKNLDLLTQQNEILQNYVDNQLEVENEVLNAIINAREMEIDELQKQRDAYQESVDKMIEGLANALDNERKIYEKQQAKDELTKLQRQLAILQRSGGSTSQIKNLQDQINTQQQDMYFEERQAQINAIQDASNKQIERMDTQISLMTETLEYQKIHGLLWTQVYSIMSQQESEILGFIMSNGSEWSSKSSLQISEDIRGLKEKIQLWTAQRDERVNNFWQIIQTQLGTFDTSFKNFINSKGYDWKTLGETEVLSLLNEWGLSTHNSNIIAKVNSIIQTQQASQNNIGTRIANSTQSIQTTIETELGTEFSDFHDFLKRKGIDWQTAGETEIINALKEWGLAKHNDQLMSKIGSIINLCTEMTKRDDSVFKEIEKGTISPWTGEPEPPSSKTSTSSTSKTSTSVVSQPEPVKLQLEIAPEEIPTSQLGDDFSNTISLNDSSNTIPLNEISNFSSTSTPITDNKQDDIYALANKSIEIFKEKGTDEQGRTKLALQKIMTIKKGESFSVIDNSQKGVYSSGSATYTGTVVKFLYNGQEYMGFSNSPRYSLLKDPLKASDLGTLSEWEKLQAKKKKTSSTKKYDSGGLIDFTGPAWVDGSKRKPESILSAEDTEILRNGLFSNKVNLPQIANSLETLQKILTESNITGTNNIDSSGINIEKLELNMNAQIRDDYSATRAGQQAFDEFVRLARKNGANSLSRR